MVDPFFISFDRNLIKALSKICLHRPYDDGKGGGIIIPLDVIVIQRSKAAVQNRFWQNFEIIARVEILSTVTVARAYKVNKPREVWNLAKFQTVKRRFWDRLLCDIVKHYLMLHFFNVLKEQRKGL